MFSGLPARLIIGCCPQYNRGQALQTSRRAIPAKIQSMFNRTSSSPLEHLRWLLWPQLGLVIAISILAYRDALPDRLLAWPYSDKVMHFILFGMVAFWLNLWLAGRVLKIMGLQVPLTPLVCAGLVMAEEFSQRLSPLRSSNFSDLAADLAGIIFFWGLSEWLVKRE